MDLLRGATRLFKNGHWRNRRVRILAVTLERKRILERVAAGHPRILIAQHIERQGTGLFRAACENNLEGGIVL